MKAPAFWSQRNLWSTLLTPAAKLYAYGSALRLRHTRGQKAAVPVICVGNVTSGGAGKTPVALALGAMLKERNINAFYLSRGYGGERTEPMMVNPSLHSAREVGDEPLLLARMLPTIVAKRRQDGAKLAAAYGAQLLIMDDGFQNPSLVKDLSLLVIDGTYGFGNGLVMPAGPLREPADTALARADAVIVVNPVNTNSWNIPQNLPVIHARTTADKSIDAFKEKNVVAFCGIAQPQKFFSMLEAHGITLSHRVAFADHHPYTHKEIESLLSHGMPLLTTAKDKVRIPAELQKHMTAIEIFLEFDDKAAVDSLLNRLSVT